MAEDIVTRATRKMKGLTRPGVKEPDTQPQTQTATAQSMSPQGQTQTAAGSNTTNESSEHLSKRSNEVIDLSQVGERGTGDPGNDEPRGQDTSKENDREDDAIQGQLTDVTKSSKLPVTTATTIPESALW
ncbi:hypothetical protein PGT21_002081 [Puccinia graminis f. sp. tritici]|uniref:Uncharacterized protein n=1 Tax=Puccinia graminis f. sp. tritici TaxID=56615 RepID=A0A5B0LUU6_PUCGR|nr:hypothetical protein PGT21_002081 [Puccinia graminis f. sp. tritici]KAA1137869.1 hypothetical protein PGTUg99_027064 [Puccinia graminis f. sp. tritici]